MLNELVNTRKKVTKLMVQFKKGFRSVGRSVDRLVCVVSQFSDLFHWFRKFLGPTGSLTLAVILQLREFSDMPEFFGCAN